MADEPIIKRRIDLTYEDLANYNWLDITTVDDSMDMYMRGEKKTPHYCVNCKYIPRSAVNYKALPIPVSIECKVVHIDFVTGRKYYKTCNEKNLDGQCKDFIVYKKENDNEL